MTKTEEQRLIRLAAAGDRASAEMMIKAHQRSLYAYLLRLSGRSDLAEDVTQEAFVRVLTNLDRFDPRFRFSTWVFTIARRLFLNFCEKKRATPAGDATSSWASGSARSESLVERGEDTLVARDVLQKGLMSLTFEQREVIILFHQQEWPIWLISDHLGMPEGTVKSHLHRGRKRLRESLDSIKLVGADSLQEALI